MTSQEQTPAGGSSIFTLGARWGEIVNGVRYDEHLDQLPGWTYDVFHAVALAVEGLPEEYQRQVAEAAVTAYVEAGGPES